MNAMPLPVQTLLLADDDADDCYLFCEAIRELSPAIRVETVANGNELLLLLGHFLPDLLFLDLDMPYKNGLECLLEIRNNAALAALPTVAFSSTSRPANIQTAYEMGAHLFLVKPPLHSEFTAALRTILHLDWRRPAAIKERYCLNGRYTAFG